MSVYVLCPCILECYKEKHYHGEILLKFIPPNPLKVAIDSDHKILNQYQSLAEGNPHLSSWLHYMSLQPSSFEKIKLKKDLGNINPLELYVVTCASVVGTKKMILYTLQNLGETYQVDENNIIHLENNCQILVLDRDSAIVDLDKKLYNKPNHIHIEGSIIAQKGSTISDSSISKGD